MKKEIWKPVIGYEGFYEVSSLGRLRSVDRIDVNTEGDKRLLSGKIIKLHKDSHGYLIAVISKNGVHKTVKIHRLVAMAFIPNPDCKRFVDHINTIRDDNRVENLRWVTARENNLNSITRKRMRVAATKDNGSGWKTIESRNKNKSAHAEIPVLQLTMDGDLVKRYRSISSAFEETGIQRATIIGVLKGRFRQAGGFLWKAENNPED